MIHWGLGHRPGPLLMGGKMLKQFFHDNDGTGPVSQAWMKHNAVKIFDKPRLVICVPIGSKLQQNAVVVDGEIHTGEAIRIPATVPIQWLTAQMQLVHPLNTSCVYMTQHGMLAGEARQVLTMNALANVQDDGYILYWDDDTLPPQMGLYKMMNYMEQHPEVGALSAVYCTREDPPEPVIYRESTTGVCWDFPMGEDAEPYDISAAGAGFLLARVSAIRAAMEKFPGEPLWADMKVSPEVLGEKDPNWGSGITWGHDVRFCRLLRLAGYKVQVDGRVECGHLDIATQVIHKLPDDCLPKRRGRKYHGEQYWNKVYGSQGVEWMRVNGDLFLQVLKGIRKHSSIVEIGCGPGVFAQLAMAQGGVMWKGYDQSSVAVEMCNAKFMNAYQKRVAELRPEDIADADYVLAMEVVEHLEPEDAQHLLKLATEARKTIIFTVPDNCMGPEEQPEHVDLFNEEKVRELTKFAEKLNYAVEIRKGDDKRLICTMVPQEESSDGQADFVLSDADIRKIGVRGESDSDVPEERSSDDAAGDSGGGLGPEPDERRVVGVGGQAGDRGRTDSTGEPRPDGGVECGVADRPKQ